MTFTPTWATVGTSETKDLSAFSASTAGASSSSNGFFTGPNELRLNNNAGTATATSLGAVITLAGSRAGCLFRCDALPATETVVLNFLTSALASVFLLALFPDGTLHLRPAADNANLATGTTVLAINTNYEIVVAFTITNTTTFTIKVWVNGYLEMTATNSGTIGSGTPDRLRFAIGSSGSGGPAANSNHWFGDQWTDKDSSNTYPGAIRAAAKRPFSNGTTNDFSDIGAGGSSYGTGSAPKVNERPLSQTNGRSFTVTGVAKTEEYNVEGVSVGDNDLTNDVVMAFVAWVFAKSGTSETASLIAAGATSNISLTSTATMFQKGVSSSSYLPGTGSDIGITTATTSTTVSLYECGIIVLFAAPVFEDGSGDSPVCMPPTRDTPVTVFA